jgi:predicted ATPase/predicted Ser/Thr protein kinase
MIGRTLSHFRIVQKLGAGEMGEVYLADDTLLGRRVALKIVRPSVAEDTQQHRRLGQEAKAAGAINHPNVTHIYEIVEAEGTRFIAMEYVDGETLHDRMKDHPLEIDDVLRFGIQIADALDAAHSRGITHRDLKPANVMVTARGQVKILDFGLAKLPVLPRSDSDSATLPLPSPGVLVGTAAYMSPEQALGHDVDHRSDIFSFGIVLYEMATGQRPFAGNTWIETINEIINTVPKPPRELNSKIPPGLDQTILRCLAKNAAHRYQSATELLDALRLPEAVHDQRERLEHREHHHNLPVQLTSFVGRQQEIAEIKRELHKTRLLTLTGTGGIGKTRLALQVAADALEHYTDGVWFVDLTSVQEPALVPPVVASTFDLREEPGRALTEKLCDYLKARQVLLILDNCEHVVTACAELVNRLLRRCSTVKILATSRELLQCDGESLWRVPSFSVPDIGSPQRLEQLVQNDVVKLFIERATAVRPGFTVNAANATAVLQVCERLDGIALAIELAAARARTMSISDLNARMQDRFQMLTGRSGLQRQQTLRTAIDWSYDLLSAKERLLFNRLSVFSGGWTLDRAEDTCSCAGIDQEEVAGLLSQLVDKSLVLASAAGGRMRYRMLATIRQYAQQKLMDTPRAEIDTLLRRYRDSFLAFAESVGNVEQSPGRQTERLDLLETEHDNLLASLEWSLQNQDGADAAIRLVAALSFFWRLRGMAGEESLKWLARALEHPGSSERTMARAHALLGAGFHAERLGKIDKARAFFEESLDIYQDWKDRSGIAESLRALGMMAVNRGEYSLAHTLFEGSLHIAQDSKDGTATQRALLNLGNVSYYMGDDAAAAQFYGESLSIARDLNDLKGLSNSLNSLANLSTRLNDFQSARHLFEESLALTREMGDKFGIATTLFSLASLTTRQGDFESAASLFKESVPYVREFLGMRGIITFLGGLAELAAARGCVQQATTLWSAAQAVREKLDLPLSSTERAEWDERLATLSEELGSEAFELAWSRGSLITLDDAMAYGLRTDLEVTRSREPGI